jgi:hypothetical protein
VTKFLMWGAVDSSGGWESLADSEFEEIGEGQHCAVPNPLLEQRLSHVCMPVIDTQIMLVDSIKVWLSLSQKAATLSTAACCHVRCLGWKASGSQSKSFWKTRTWDLQGAKCIRQRCCLPA